MSTCRECGSPTGLGSLCLPCRKGVKNIRQANEGPFQRLCKRCGEPLTTRVSRQRGYGPTCWVIVQVEGEDA